MHLRYICAMPYLHALSILQAGEGVDEGFEVKCVWNVEVEVVGVRLLKLALIEHLEDYRQ